MAVSARIWVSPTAPSRSSLAPRARGAGALEEHDRLEQVRVALAARPRPRSAAASADHAARRGERAARALRVEHVAAAGGGPPDELVARGRLVRERVGLAGVDVTGPKAGGSSPPVKARPASVAPATSTSTKTNRRARRSTRGSVSAVRTIAAVGAPTVGLFAINSHSCAEPEAAVRIAELAERLGYDSLWAGEHVVVPSPRVEPSPMEPEEPILDPLVALAHLAARTERVRLGTGVIILPQRNPLVLAKQVASLDVLSGRAADPRASGSAYLEPEMPPSACRWRAAARARTSTSAAMRSLWEDDAPAFRGATSSSKAWTPTRDRCSARCRSSWAATRERALPARGAPRGRLVRLHDRPARDGASSASRCARRASGPAAPSRCTSRSPRPGRWTPRRSAPTPSSASSG